MHLSNNLETPMDGMPFVFLGDHIDAVIRLLYKHPWISFVSLIFLWEMVQKIVFGRIFG